MEALLTRTPQGSFIPWGDEEAAKLGKIKAGAAVRAKIVQMRNPRFFKKWWVLAKFAFDIWSDTMPMMQWRGQPVRPEFDKFRQDLTIMAGYYRPVWNIKGEMRVEAESLRWDKMDETTFEALFSATIQAILTKVLSRPDLTEEKVRQYVDGVLRFD
jgi:hypothetical protein